jgi:hypothetical protein
MTPTWEKLPTQIECANPACDRKLLVTTDDKDASPLPGTPPEKIHNAYAPGVQLRCVHCPTCGHYTYDR